MKVIYVNDKSLWIIYIRAYVRIHTYIYTYNIHIVFFNNKFVGNADTQPHSAG